MSLKKASIAILLVFLAACDTDAPPEAWIDNVRITPLYCEACPPAKMAYVQLGGAFRGLDLTVSEGSAHPMHISLPDDPVEASGPQFSEPKIVYKFSGVETPVTFDLVRNGEVIDSYARNE